MCETYSELGTDPFGPNIEYFKSALVDSQATPCYQNPNSCGCGGKSAFQPPERWNLYAIPYFKLYPNYSCPIMDVRKSSRSQVYTKWKLKYD